MIVCLYNGPIHKALEKLGWRFYSLHYPYVVLERPIEVESLHNYIVCW